jgi:hypothetical protein
LRKKFVGLDSMISWPILNLFKKWKGSTFMSRNIKSFLLAAAVSVALVQPAPSQAKNIFKALAKKLNKKKGEKKKPQEKPFDKTPTGFGRGDDLVIGIDKIMGGACKRGGGATAYKLTVSAILWTKSEKYGMERVGPVEVYTEEIAPVNPKQTVTSESEIRVPIDQVNAAFDELGYGRFVADKADVIGSTLGIGIDPVGPCSKLDTTPYRGYSFVTPSVYLDFPNPYYGKIGRTQLITQKPQTVTVTDNDAARLGEAQGSSTKTMISLTVGIEDHE